MTAGKQFTYRLCDTTDPEERLEDAALWKAMHDVFGDRISVSAAHDAAPDYGRGRALDKRRVPEVTYWHDPAFLAHAQRSFWVGPWDTAGAEVERLHRLGLDAFVKSTRPKHWIERIPVGVSLDTAADATAYTFIDDGPALMVQELAEMRYEHRFFVVNRHIVTHSPNAVHLTPLDYPQTFSFVTPHERQHGTFCASGFLRGVAEDIARKMETPDAVIDCALINGKPGCVEINPLAIGGVGLFACDVRSLALAIYQRDVVSRKAA